VWGRAANGGRASAWIGRTPVPKSGVSRTKAKPAERRAYGAGGASKRALREKGGNDDRPAYGGEIDRELLDVFGFELCRLLLAVKVGKFFDLLDM
jgi:hypothetical protein